ncbi:hypothetical protein DSM03_10178 [Leeuwenhoekiella aestuarii]|uniref:hypothetical protein n=1 Tax=Leeuwenhoekiella aestuarii TaxID=2249426 RepID=UPI000FFEA479|nr:hypothetical protein [Leeuwenhoekiella aestuarii]RXG18714.1 hypothetical protein DSM03_10178 [Leeuwenhoekiella aestuarii]
MGKSLKSFKKEFEKKWVGLSAVVIGIAGLFSIGYYCGNYLMEISCEREKLAITEQYQEKIFEHRSSCNSYMVDGLLKKTSVMELTIEQLKNIKNEK